MAEIPEYERYHVVNQLDTWGNKLTSCQIKLVNPCHILIACSLML